MNFQIWSSQPKIAQQIRVFALMLTALIAFLGLLCGGTFVYSKMQLAALGLQENSLSNQMQTAQKEIQSSGTAVKYEVPVGQDGIKTMQSEIQRSAQSSGVRLVEIASNQGLAPHVTRFDSKGADDAWREIEFNLSLSGTANQLASMLNSLDQSRAPFEFSSFTLNRETLSKSGLSQLRAQLVLRAIVAAEGGKS